MQLSNFSKKLQPVTSTSLEVLAYGTQEPLGLFLEGHTPDSAEWKKIVRKVQGAPKGQRINMTKSGSFIDIKPEDKPHSDEELIAVSAITGAYGFDEKEKQVYLSEADLETLKGNLLSDWGHVLESWQEHLDKRSNFLA